MSNNSLEIVHEGWLTKSPPSKPIWRARWRRRWFVLRHSGELPGQYFLEYYTDRNCRKLKGKIDLDQCEQVDAGLRYENSKQKYQYMFDVKTPKRTYFLAAESNEEMNKWVEYVCHICRLIAYKEEEEDCDYDVSTIEETAIAATATGMGLEMTPRQDFGGDETESPPISPTSTTSGPYIPISECISGDPILTPNGLEDLNNLIRQGGYSRLTASVQYAPACSSQWRGRKVADAPRQVEMTSRAPLLPVKRPDARMSNDLRNDEFYDSPRQLHQHGGAVGTPPTSPTTTDGESVFTDDEWVAPVLPLPSVNWETFPNADGENIRPSRLSDGYEVDSDIGSWSVVRKFGKLTVVDSKRFVPASVHGRRNQTLPHKPAPPRPPKPVHLIDGPSHNYLNLENITSRPKKQKTVIEPIAEAAIAAPSTEPVPPSPTAAAPTPTPPISPPHTEVIVGAITDETYDFPRSHQQANSECETPDAQNHPPSNRHCYTNAAPTQVTGNIFRYDFHHNDAPLAAGQDLVVAGAGDEPTSPRSEGSGSIASTAAIYSNLPSPLILAESGGIDGIPTPPAVNRGLKPGRKLSDSTSAVSGSELSPGTPGHFPPSVDRKLKPFLKHSDTPSEQAGAPLQLAPPPDGSRSLRKTRAAPSPTPPSAIRNGLRQRSEHNSSSDDDNRNSLQDEEIYFYQDNHRFVPASLGKRFPEIQYLDLEHDAVGASSSSSVQTPKSPERCAPTTTVYKTVDFLKTQAFNKTRQKVEEDRKLCTADLL